MCSGTSKVRASAGIALLLSLALLLGACMGEPLPPPDARYALGACPPALAGYVALGSSSTEGTGASDIRRTAYVALLRERLRATCPDLRALNLGRGGARVDTFLAQVPEIEHAAPSIITILPFADFANTPPADFSRDYAALFDRLRPLGATIFVGDQRLDRRYICGVRPQGQTCYGTDAAQRIADKNQALAALARTRPWVVLVPIVDSMLPHPEWLAADGQHPNDQGHADLARQFWPALAAWVKRSR
jgi:lysophospholipase L1-like esterase